MSDETDVGTMTAGTGGGEPVETPAANGDENNHITTSEANGGFVDSDDGDDGDGGVSNENDEKLRLGSVSSARFNILSTMVGGGCLSLPMAFQKSGNALVGPLFLLIVGLISEFCFRILVTCSVKLQEPHPSRVGQQSFESIASAALGPKAYILSMGLVTATCFFGAVGYSVLLRDMMEPINDWILHGPSGGGSGDDSEISWFHKNLTMFAVALIVTPATTLQTFTALKSCGAASMMSVLVLGTCIVIRSIQCNAHESDIAPNPWYTYLTFFPESPRDLLDALPLYISCFVCHYNIPPVHNELANPTRPRVSWWLRSTTWFANILYLIMGFAGSSHGHCTATGKVQGNVLLDFDENDPLLMVGRLCLALTITLAFPLLVIPAREIFLRSIIIPMMTGNSNDQNDNLVSEPTVTITNDNNDLSEPLLANDDAVEEGEVVVFSSSDGQQHDDDATSPSLLVRLISSVAIFWLAAIFASCVESIDIVWDLLGSSLSIILSYLIPCGSYLVLMKDEDGCFWSKTLCWSLIALFVPLMFISTGNAVVNTFGQ